MNYNDFYKIVADFYTMGLHEFLKNHKWLYLREITRGGVYGELCELREICRTHEAQTLIEDGCSDSRVLINYLEKKEQDAIDNNGGFAL